MPLEIKLGILDYLDEKSKSLTRVASTEWFKIIKYDEFIFPLSDKSRLPFIINALKKYSNPIGLTLRLCRFDPVDPTDMEALAQLSQLTQLTKLVVDQGSFNWPVSQWLRFSTLTNLRHFYFASQNNVGLAELLPHFPNLVESPSIGFSEVNSLTALTNLQYLQVRTSREDNVEVLEKLKFPGKLTKIFVGEDRRRAAGTIALCEKMLTSLAGLKHLHWFNYSQPCPHTSLPNLEFLRITRTRSPLHFNTNLTGLQFVLDPLDQTSELVKLTKLQSLNINYGDIEEFVALTYLTALKELQRFSIFAMADLQAELICPFIVSTTLTALEWRGSSAKLSAEISRLTALQSLSLSSGANSGWLTLLTNLTNLESRAQFGNENYVEKLTKLKSLMIFAYGAKFGLADLTNLEILKLRVEESSDNAVNGLEHLTKLKVLHIFTGKQFDVSFLQKATDLIDLKLCASAATGFWDILPRLTKLRCLNIEDTITVDQATMLLPLTRLTSLQIRATLPNELTSQFDHVYSFKCNHPQI